MDQIISLLGRPDHVACMTFVAFRVIKANRMTIFEAQLFYGDLKAIVKNQPSGEKSTIRSLLFTAPAFVCEIR